jgi:ADP-ribose pyrophosphatase
VPLLPVRKRILDGCGETKVMPFISTEQMQILKIDKLTNEKWLNLFSATFKHDGKPGRWVFASRNRNPQDKKAPAEAVVIVPILRTRGQAPRLVIVKTFRVPIGDYIYELPAGLVEDGEAVEETVRRELREETGLEVVRIRHITPPLYSSSGMTDETARMAFVDARRTKGNKQELDGSEDIEVIELSHAQACALCKKPVRMDVRLWCILHHFQQFGKLE